ncbi:hypothetical protein EI94DRAFT_1821569 [Lactarius quietus]|nr:hypothetical protein EI94DRAFT_1821569 [Lactarius quietus]
MADLGRVVGKRTKAERVLFLLVESGVFYIISDSIMVASSLIRLPGSHYILESLYSQAAVHLAGIYPLLVVILVDREASMDKTLFNSALPAIITDPQHASSHLIASSTVACQLKDESTPMAGIQFAARKPPPTWGYLDPSFSQDSMSSSSSLESGV